MKKQLLPLIFLTLCLALSACGGKASISGEVVEATPAALVLETDEGKRVAVLLEEDTLFSSRDDFDGDKYKAAPHTGVRVSFSQAGRAGSITAADGTRVKAYRADHVIWINAYLVREAAVLSDGTVLDAWQGSGKIIYQTQDGVELLWENTPHGPEYHYVGGQESFDDLSEEAKPHVTEFYQKQGKLYDLQTELERAWTAYQTDPGEFSTFFVGQESYPAASSERVLYFGTRLLKTVSGNMGQETNLYAVFDRETGANIPLEDLFVCPEEDIGKKLLDLAEKGGTGPLDPTVKAEMEAAFQMEFLGFSQDSLWLEFPWGALPSEEHGYFVSVEFTEECKALLQPWAVPCQ